LNEFQSNIIRIYGNKGKKWLDNLAKTVKKISDKYFLSGLSEAPNLCYNYVASGIMEGEKAIILKLSLDHKSLKQEISALKAFEGFGVAKVLFAEDEMMIQERVIPGTSLDNENIDAACKVIERLQMAPVPNESAFPHIRDWLEAIPGDFTKACEIRDYLIKTSKQKALLHGDFHHDNILKHGDEYIAIDPKGVIGELEYEISNFIRNPNSLYESKNENEMIDIIQTRISKFTQNLNLSEDRIRLWCYVSSVLALVWATEDQLELSPFANKIMIFEKLI